MIQIKKNKKGLFHVTYVAENGEILAHSENLRTKQSCFKNIGAMYRNFPQVDEVPMIIVKDLCGKKSVEFYYNIDTKTKSKL